MKLESILLLAGVALVAYMLLRRAETPAPAATATSDYNGVNVGRTAIDNLAYYYRDGA